MRLNMLPLRLRLPEEEKLDFSVVGGIAEERRDDERVRGTGVAWGRDGGRGASDLERDMRVETLGGERSDDFARLGDEWPDESKSTLWYSSS